VRKENPRVNDTQITGKGQGKVEGSGQRAKGEEQRAVHGGQWAVGNDYNRVIDKTGEDYLHPAKYFVSHPTAA